MGIIDRGIVKADQHSTGTAFEENQAIGKSVGSLPTPDAHGFSIDFEITGVEVHNCKIALEFIGNLFA